MLKLTLLLAAFAFSLPASYLISVSAVSYSTIQLSWRNNSSSTKGVLVIRKDSTELSYHFVDSVLAPVSTYSDSTLKGSTLYYYRIIAFSDSGLSDSSNTDSAATPAAPPPPPLPKLHADVSIGFVSYDTSGKVTIRISDCESLSVRCRVFRSENYGPFIQVADFPYPTDPRYCVNYCSCTTYTWIDSSVSFNTRYAYRADIYNDYDTVRSPTTTATAFTHKPSQARTYLALSTKTGSLPIYYGDWSAKDGDTIILNEYNAPANNSTLINVHDLNNPVFIGYRPNDSIFASVRAAHNNILLTSGYNAYRISNGVPHLINRIPYNSPPTSPCYFLYDNLFISASDQYQLMFISDSFICPIVYNTIFIPAMPQGDIIKFASHSFLEHWVGMVGCGKYCTKLDSGYVITSFRSLLYPTNTTRTTTYPGANYFSPFQFEDYIFQDSIILNARNMFVDTVHSAVFILTDTALDIYNYSVIGLEDKRMNPNSCKVDIHPNPFNPSTTVSYYVPSFLPVSIELYDLTGRRISTIQNTRQHTGEYKVTVNAKDHPSGIYILRSVIGSHTSTNKLILLK